MGGGSRVKQYKRRFFQGESIHKEREGAAFNVVKTFGEYEIREAKKGEYELLKGNEVVGMFSEAQVKDDRVIFKLSRGMRLEVSEKGIRKILAPEKAELCGLIASDGGIFHRVYEVYFDTKDEKLVEVFSKLVETVYGITPRYYKYHRTVEGEERIYHKPRIYNREVAYDLEDLCIKGPKPYEFHPPIKYLDDEGKRAYLRGSSLEMEVFL